MRYLLLLPAFYLQIGALSTQDSYQPTLGECSRWTLRENVGMGGFNNWNYHLSSDTVEVNGQSYREVIFEDEILNEECFPDGGGYVREDIAARKLFFLPATDTLTECLIADFSLAVGDTFYFSPNNGFEVEEIIEVERFGQTFKFFRIPEPTGFWGYYEGYGRSVSGVLPNCDNNYSVGGYSNDCITDTENLAGFGGEELYWSPNPFNDQIRLVGLAENDTGPIQIEVYTELGQLVMQREISIVDPLIDLSQFPNRLYLIRARGEGWLRTFKVLKN